MGQGAKGWWYRATQAQRLAQIDGGIECGMTAAEIARACGAASRFTIAQFAEYHRRQLPATGHVRSAKVRRERGNVRRAYWQGDRDLSDSAIAHRNSSTDDEVSELVL